MKKKRNEDGGTGELLGEMYRNVMLECESIADAVSSIGSREMISDVTSQLETYADFASRTEKLLAERNITPGKVSKMQKMMTKGSIVMNTMFDSTDGHIAGMIAQGTNAGADRLENELNRIGGQADQDAAALCREILAYERSEAAKMQGFTEAT